MKELIINIANPVTIIVLIFICGFSFKNKKKNQTLLLWLNYFNL